MHSEGSQKEKSKYHINTNIQTLERWYWWTYLQGSNGDADIENRLVYMGVGEKEVVGPVERVTWKHIHYHMQKDSQWEFVVWLRELKPGLCDTLEGWDGVGVEGKFKRERTYVYLWLIHADVWEKPTQWKWNRSVLSVLCDPVDYSPPGSSIHGILQARVLEWVAISFSRGSSQPRVQIQVSHISGRCFAV